MENESFASIQDRLDQSEFSPLLERVVSGVTAFVMDFDGPPAPYVGGIHYVTVCSDGVKEPNSEGVLFGFEESIKKYADQLKLVIENSGKHQLAWRVRPKLVKKGHLFCVFSRLAMI